MISPSVAAGRVVEWVLYRFAMLSNAKTVSPVCPLVKLKIPINHGADLFPIIVSPCIRRHRAALDFLNRPL